MDVPIKSKIPELKNPFVIPGIRNIKIESQLNPNYNFENFLEGDSNGWPVPQGWLWRINPGVLHSTPC